MKTIVIAIYDKATEAYMRPSTFQSKGQAIRMFIDEANREGSEIGRHPEDFSLFHIGNYTDHDAKLEPIDPICLQRAHEIPQETN